MTFCITTEYYAAINVASLIIVELKFAAHAYDFYGRTLVQHSINNTTTVALLD